MHVLTGEIRRGSETEQNFLAYKLMPNSKVLQDFGRWDLHNAVKANGGFKAVASHLKRVLYSDSLKKKQKFLNFKVLAKEVEDFMQEYTTSTIFPSQSQLRKFGRYDLDQAITSHGGYAKVASIMGVKLRSRPKYYWQDVENVLSEIRAFTAANNMNENTCPTFSDLTKSGRYDLKYALELHSRKKILDLLAPKNEY